MFQPISAARIRAGCRPSAPSPSVAGAHQQESVLIQPGRNAGAGLRAVHLNAPPANPCRSLLDARREFAAALAGSSSPSVSRSSDFSRETSSAWRLMRTASFEIERSCGRGEVGVEVALVNVDADAHDCVERTSPFSIFDSTRMPPVLRGPISRSLGQRRSTLEPACLLESPRRPQTPRPVATAAGGRLAGMVVARRSHRAPVRLPIARHDRRALGRTVAHRQSRPSRAAQHFVRRPVRRCLWNQ